MDIQLTTSRIITVENGDRICYDQNKKKYRFEKMSVNTYGKDPIVSQKNIDKLLKEGLIVKKKFERNLVIQKDTLVYYKFVIKTQVENKCNMWEFENQNPTLKEQFKIETGFDSIELVDEQFPQWNSDYIKWLESKVNKVAYEGETLFEERNRLSKSNEKEVDPVEEINPNETEYELYINEPNNTPFRVVDSWLPIDFDRIKDKSKIKGYIDSGVLRVAKKTL